MDLFLDGEIWKNIEEYSGDYQISNFGRIKSFKINKINGQILKQHRNGINGYLYVEDNPNSILIEIDVIKIWKHLNEGILTQREIGKLFGVSRRTISNIKNKKTWNHITRSI